MSMLLDFYEVTIPVVNLIFHGLQKIGAVKINVKGLYLIGHLAYPRDYTLIRMPLW